MTPEDRAVLEKLIETIGKFWLLPRDEFLISHVDGDEEGTTYISFIRKHKK